MNRLEALAAAEAKVRDVRRTMNLTAGTCASCDHVTYNDYTEFLLARELDAIVRKLVKIRTELAAKGKGIV